jgi:protein-tyrosine phosphatase
LLRTARLNRLTDSDREWLASIGLRTVIDLRQSFEIQAWPDNLGDLRVERVNTPPSLETEGTGTFFDLYLEWLDNSAAAFAGAIRTLARPGALPALIHCTAGKDRTGLVVAMVLDVLGVEEKVIVADYLESNTRLTTDPGDVQFQYPIREELMTGSLAHLRERFGSVEGYLLANGVTAEDLATLRAELLGTA